MGDDGVPAVDARSLVAALADESRLRIFAAALLAPGATPAALAERLDTPVRAIVQHAGKLMSVGLLAREPDGGLTARLAPFRSALRDIDARDTTAPPGAGVDRAVDALFTRGKLVDMPAESSLRHRLLERLVTDFEPGSRYSETEVRDILRRRHDDHAALRRYLVDDGLLDRDARGAYYWRR
jgi:hypothetical protein